MGKNAKTSLKTSLMISKYRLIFSFALLTFSSQLFSADSGIVGVWKTESSDKGYLHVSIDNCGDAVCGTILKALSLEDEPNADYEHLGKNMIWDMKSNGSDSWSKGKIWDPSKDKTYKSK